MKKVFLGLLLVSNILRAAEDEDLTKWAQLVSIISRDTEDEARVSKWALMHTFDKAGANWNSALAFDQANEQLAVIEGDSIDTYDTTKWEKIFRASFATKGKVPRALCFGSENLFAAAIQTRARALGDGDVVLFDPRTNKEIRTITTGYGISALRFNRLDDKMAVGAAKPDSVVQVYDLKAEHLVNHFTLNGEVLSLAFNSDTELTSVHGFEHKHRTIWDLVKKFEARRETLANDPSDACLDSQGKRLLSSNWIQSKVMLQEGERQPTTEIFDNGSKWTNHLTISPDGTLVAVWSDDDNKIRIWKEVAE